MLDEPTAGLDPLMQQKFFNLIREENKRGATVFFSSHILGEVQKLCNRVAIIKEGRIINVQEIKTLQKDNYKKIRVTGRRLDEETLQGRRGDPAGKDRMARSASSTRAISTPSPA